MTIGRNDPQILRSNLFGSTHQQAGATLKRKITFTRNQMFRADRADRDDRDALDAWTMLWNIASGISTNHDKAAETMSMLGSLSLTTFELCREEFGRPERMLASQRS